MDNAFEKARAAYGTGAYDDATLEFLFPQLKESEDERIVEDLIGGLMWQRDNLGRLGPHDDNLILPGFCENVGKHLAWIEKQKEQPQEELVYRLNGLMQEYIKEGKDEAEKEHRFKCYQLFWDALEDADFFEQKEQKPAWSEENELTIADLINYFEGDSLGGSAEEMVQRIKSLRPQPKQEWSDKEKGILLECISVLQSNSHWLLADELKSLRPQPKQKWSEEDEKVIDTIVSVLGQYIDYKAVSGTGSGYATPRYSKEIDWLKSLRPQPKQEVPADTEVLTAKLVNLLKSYRIGEVTATGLANRIADTYGTQRYLDGLCDGKKGEWRPSEEQMKALKWWSELPNCSPGLISLYEDLKKL